MTIRELAKKSPGPFALAIGLAILYAMFIGWPKVGQLAWANETDEKIASTMQSVARLSDDAKEIKAQLLAQDLFKTRRDQCDAIANATGARFWTERLMKMRQDYSRLTGEDYDLPDCSEL